MSASGRLPRALIGAFVLVAFGRGSASETFVGLLAAADPVKSHQHHTRYKQAGHDGSTAENVSRFSLEVSVGAHVCVLVLIVWRAAGGPTGSAMRRLAQECCKRLPVPLSPSCLRHTDAPIEPATVRAVTVGRIPHHSQLTGLTQMRGALSLSSASTLRTQSPALRLRSRGGLGDEATM